MTIDKVIKICEDYFPTITWTALKGGRYFGGEYGMDQLEFINDHTLVRFGAGKLDFSSITDSRLIEWLKSVGMSCIDTLEDVNNIIEKPEIKENGIVLGYEINSRWSNELGYLNPGLYKLIKFEDMSEYKIWIEQNSIIFIEKV